MSSGGSILKRLFKNELTIEEIENSLNNIMHTDTKLGKTFKIGNRVIYPIVQIYRVENKNFISVEIFPVAFFIKEEDQEYALSFNGEEIEKNVLMEEICTDNTKNELLKIIDENNSE